MSRLTKKYDGEDVEVIGNEYKAFQKLGDLEDILEEYGIEDLTDLIIALDYYNHRYDGGIYTERVVVDDK
jgi:hypothetical protein